MMEAGWATRRVARQLGRYDSVEPLCLLEPYEGAWLKDIWDRGSNYERCPLPPPHQRLRLEWCRARGNWTAAEWNQVVFSDESRFNLSSYDNSVRVWKPRGEQPSGMSMTSRNHMFCHSCNGSQEPFFNKTMLGLTRQGCHKTASALLLPFLGLLDPQICFQSSISGIIWNGELSIPRV
ncbi:transposable element Tcb2 transposase [Trichonephila clavipes]|nr:transposable element Tcb2 transposase [Trichonephila clavipes]